MSAELNTSDNITTLIEADKIPVSSGGGLKHVTGAQLQSEIDNKSAAARDAATASAATDASTKAGNAQTAAIAAAATDATTKANNAQTAATNAAAADATTKANSAQSAAIATAAADATTKANSAQAAAAADATSKASTAQSAAIATAASDATTKADAARDAAIADADGKFNLTSLTTLTEAQIADDDYVPVRDTSASANKKAQVGEISKAVNRNLTGDSVTEFVSLKGTEYMPVVQVNPVTGVKTTGKVMLDMFNPNSDSRVPRKYKDRNYGPHAVKVIDTISDVLNEYSSGVNNSTTTAPTVSVATRRGSAVKTNAARFGGEVTILNDVKAVYGTKRVKLVTGKRTLGGGSALGDPAQNVDYSIYRRDDIGQIINATGLWVRIDLETPDPTAIDEIQFYIGDSALANFYRWNNLIGDQATRPLQFGTKTRIAFPLLVAGAGSTLLGTTGYNNSVTGTPNIANCTSMQIRLLGKADAGATISATVYVDRFALVQQTSPVISLCMDDGYETWHSIAKEILDRNAQRGTLFCIRGYHQSNTSLNSLYNPAIVGTPGNSFRLSETQIKNFLDAGHELGFHMFGNNAREDYSPQEVENEIIAYKKWAKEIFDYDVLTAAYPGGENGPFVGPNFPVGHGRNPQEGYTDYAGYNSGLATTPSFLDGKPKKYWGDWSANNKKPDGTAYASDAEVTVRDVFAKHFPFSRSIVLNSPETDPPTDGALIRSFLYQFGPALVPSSGTRLGLKSASPSYNGRNTVQRSTGTLAVGGTTTCTLAATDSTTAGDYVNNYIEIVGGTGFGQVRKITDYTTGRVATVEKPFIPATDATSVYRVMIPKNMAIVDSIISSNGIGVASYHDLFYAYKAGGGIATGGTTSVTLDSRADATANAYTGKYLILTKGTGAGQIRKITAYTAARVATLSTALSPAADTTSLYEIFDVKQSGTLAAGGTATVTLPAGASATAQEYLGAFIVTTGGTGSGQIRKITNYTTGKVATVDIAFSPATDATTTYDIFNNSQEVLLTNETGNAQQIVATNPFNLNSLGTQSAQEDLENLCDYILKKGVSCIPLREALTRSL